MGYTHYYPQTRSFTPDEWAAVQTAARQITSFAMTRHDTGVALAFELDEPTRPPQIDGEVIRFNGVGDAGCETFMVYRSLDDLVATDPSYFGEQLRRDGEAFQFTKTNREPYDVVVVAMLSAIAALAPGALNLGSDGDADEWKPGVTLAKRALPSTVIPNPMTDVIISDQGSLVMFSPLSAEAQAFFDKYVESESWRWMGGALAVEHRYAPALWQGLVDEGFSVEAD